VELADQAMQIAQAFVPDVINLLEVPGKHQVLLKVKVAEVARSFRENLGVDFYFNNRGMYTGSLLGELSSGSLDGGQIDVGDAANLFFGLRSTNVDVFVQALHDQGLLQILAEPNLVARSGETATFLAGGEFPVPIVQGGMSDNVTIEYKEYGVRLNFTPTVLSDRVIHLDVSPEVSDLDFSQGVQFGGYVIPLVLTRRAHTVVKMEKGQTFAIAGLISQTKQKGKRKVPVMGDLPVLGNLFQSRSLTARETELLILITPEIVAPLREEQAQRQLIEQATQPAPAQAASGYVREDTSMLYLKSQNVVGPEIQAAN
jgi:pilus assembly protein CpaC